MWLWCWGCYAVYGILLCKIQVLPFYFLIFLILKSLILTCVLFKIKKILNSKTHYPLYQTYTGKNWNKENGHLDIFLLGTTALSSTVHLRDAALSNILVKQSFSFVSPEAFKCVCISYLVLKSPFRVCLGQLRRLKMVTKAVLFLTLLESIL